MQKSKKTLLNFSVGLFSVLSLILLAFPGNTSALAAQGYNLFGDTADNKVTPNCYLRKEYNYFMNQWTTNETCNPRVDQVAPKPLRLGNSNANANISDNIYLGPTTYNSAPVVYNSAPAYSAPNYSYTGFYTGNNNGLSNNNWNGYGNSANYLLGSFGGGYGSGSIGSYGYYNNYYPNSVFAYTPTAYDVYDSGYNEGYYYLGNSTSLFSNYHSMSSADQADYEYGFGLVMGDNGYSVDQAYDAFNQLHETDL